MKKTAAVAAATPAKPAAAPAKPAAAPAKPASAAKKPEPVAEVVAAAAAETAAAPVAPSGFAEIQTLLSSLISTVKEVVSKVKVLEKDYAKKSKIVEKAETRRARARTSPSGFAVPVPISAEMAGFLKVAAGTLLSRTDVTRRITAYVKEHQLYDPKNKRQIRPDAALAKILGTADKEEVSYFSLQKHLRNHFVKATA
jgi:chromatin remodeling complex protein RSC6